jgi:vacuolar-type H+-ATPase subunit F/Vma7
MTTGTAHLVIVAPAVLAGGFRLAGARMIEAADVAEAQQAVLGLIDEGERGVIGVHQPWLADFEAALQARLESSVAPLVVALPSGVGLPPAEAHRARIAGLVQRAVGYHITFGESPRE